MSGANQSHYSCNMCKQVLPRESFSKNSGKERVRPVNYRCRVCCVIQRAITQYKITLEEYNKLHSRGSCAICGVPQKDLKRSLFIDHDHKTGKIRDTLCEPCNSALGLAKDSPVILNKAKEYLSSSKDLVMPLGTPKELTGMKKWRLLKVFGMTPANYFGLLETQGGRCPICSAGLANPMIDHCHSSGKVRGLLCWDCNVMLGKLKDSAETINSALMYLEKHS